MPDLKVGDKVRFENFIRMTWADFEELHAVVAPIIVKKSTKFRSVASSLSLSIYIYI